VLGDCFYDRPSCIHLQLYLAQGDVRWTKMYGRGSLPDFGSHALQQSFHRPAFMREGERIEISAGSLHSGSHKRAISSAIADLSPI
jgi:hypothetical protein